MGADPITKVQTTQQIYSTTPTDETQNINGGNSPSVFPAGGNTAEEDNGTGWENFDYDEYIKNAVLKEHPEIDISTRKGRKKLIQLIIEKKLEIIQKASDENIDISSLSEKEKLELIQKNDMIIRGIIHGMKARGIDSLEEYIETTSFTQKMTDKYNAAKEYALKYPERAKRNSEVQETIQRYEHFQEVLDFAKANNIEEIDNIEDLMKSPQFKNIEYKYLQGKKDLTEFQKGELEVLQTIANWFGDDLTNVEFSEFGDGSYCREFKDAGFLRKMVNKVTGNDLENKIKKDLSGLSPEEQQAKIAEILKTAANKKEAWLLLTQLAKLQKEGIIDAKAVVNGIGDAGNTVQVAAAVSTEMGAEGQTATAEKFAQEAAKEDSIVTDTQVKSYMTEVIPKGYEEEAQVPSEELMINTNREAAIEAWPEVLEAENFTTEQRAELIEYVKSLPEEQRAPLMEKAFEYYGENGKNNTEILEMLNAPAGTYSENSSAGAAQSNEEGSLNGSPASSFGYTADYGTNNENAYYNNPYFIGPKPLSEYDKQMSDNNPYAANTITDTNSMSLLLNNELNSDEVIDVTNMSTSEIITYIKSCTDSGKKAVIQMINDEQQIRNLMDSLGADFMYRVTKGTQNNKYVVMEIKFRKGSETELANLYNNEIKKEEEQQT